MARLTKKEIIDYIVYEATGRLFFGDGRDTKIALQNFKLEVFRCGAKACGRGCLAYPTNKCCRKARPHSTR